MAGAADPSPNDYSFIDRLLHRFAFAHPVVQKALGEIESDVFAARFASTEIVRPVFVTGLPRAGTTLLLEMLYATGEFATFTYRDMPFVLAPLLWSSMTKSVRKEGRSRERAHGDGMEISFDSPEAFEEVAWLAYLRDRYVSSDRLATLNADDITPEFRQAFAKLIRKRVAAGGTKRYLSKNNANIGRIGAVRSIFPDATIFICLREPVSHVRSLMTQHERFLDLHKTDDFARSYMRWIGHYDFGANFRPIDFAGRGAAPSALTADFWLQYWIDAYSFAADRIGDGIHIVCYERLFEDPRGALTRVTRAAGLAAPEDFLTNAARIRPPTTAAGEVAGADPGLLSQAGTLYEHLKRAALTTP